MLSVMHSKLFQKDPGKQYKYEVLFLTLEITTEHLLGSLLVMKQVIDLISFEG